MADGVDITPGSGAKVATDDAGAAGHAQIVKLSLGANGDASFVEQAVPVKQKAGTSAVTSVGDSGTSVQLLAANAARLGATIYNDSAEILCLKLGTTASTTSFTHKLYSDDYYEVPFGYTGAIEGIWAADGAGAARITELTA
jgi:hypothetical protein